MSLSSGAIVAPTDSIIDMSRDGNSSISVTKYDKVDENVNVAGDGSATTTELSSYSLLDVTPFWA